MSLNTSSLETPIHANQKTLTKTFLEYFFPLLISILFSLIILQITSFSRLKYPFDYYGDTIFYSMTIKSVLTTGWYLTNPFIGAPGEHFLGDFPTPEGLNYLIIKIMALFTTDWVLILNLFFLLSFPLITLTSLFVFRQLSICYPFSCVASLLYAFLPYHLIKGESHLFLSSYYLAPLAIWITLLLYQNKLFVYRNNVKNWNFDNNSEIQPMLSKTDSSSCCGIDPSRKKYLFFLFSLICILIGSNGVYHAYFSSFFFLLAGAIASFRERQWGPLKYASCFIMIILISIIVNISSTIIYDYKHHINYKVVKRDSLQVEHFGLKIAQLVLPRDHDRLFSKMKNKYNQRALSVTENTTSSLGIIACLGFVYLIGSLFFRNKTRPSPSTIEALANLNLGALLLATMGGFSSLLSILFLSGIRAYNRISIFIAFYSLAAFFMLLQKKVKTPKLIWGCSLLILAIGLFSQSSPIDAPDIRYPKLKKEYQLDHAFIQKIEQALPPHSMIFQLPYIYFPEGPRDKINSYAHFKPHLHTDKFRWSFGTMRNRKTDKWQKRTSGLPLLEMIPELKRKGFTGLYVDKFGYDDAGSSLTSQLSQILKAPPIFDKYGRSFWDLRELTSAE